MECNLVAVRMFYSSSVFLAFFRFPTESYCKGAFDIVLLKSFEKVAFTIPKTLLFGNTPCTRIIKVGISLARTARVCGAHLLWCELRALESGHRNPSTIPVRATRNAIVWVKQKMNFSKGTCKIQSPDFHVWG